jgi:hypothetical protein
MSEHHADVVIEQVRAILLADGSHHAIHPGSLEIGQFLFRSADGSHRPSASEAGFVVQRTDGTRMVGPVRSLLALIG